MDNNTNSSFWQFSDNLRLQTSSLADLSLNDSIWSTNYTSKRRNFDFRNDVISEQQQQQGRGQPPKSSSDLNVNDVWKADSWKLPNNDALNLNYSGFGSGLNGGFNKGVYNSPSLGLNSNYGFNNGYGNKGKGFLNSVVVNGKVSNTKGGKNEEEHLFHGSKIGKKNNKGNKDNKEGGNKDSNNENKVDKRFKTLPPSEALPRNETIGGYIFVCNNDTMAENLKRQLFGLPPRYRDSVRAITPGLPLFLYNYSTHQLHGIFEAASFGGTNIDPSAWEDKKNPGESRFPAQVRVVTRKICDPLEEDSFRPILHHYDGPKFRLELNVPEALSLLDIFAESNNHPSMN